MTLTQAIEWLRGLDKGATDGPWRYDHGNQEVEAGRERWNICDILLYRSGLDPDKPHPGWGELDGELIASLRNVLPQLIAVVEAAQALTKATRWSTIEENRSSLPAYSDVLVYALMALAKTCEKEMK